MLLVDNGDRLAANMKVKTFRGGVKIRIVGLLDPVAMTGDLSVGEDGMGQLFANLRERRHLFEQDITVAKLSSHERIMASQRKETMPNWPVQEEEEGGKRSTV